MPCPNCGSSITEVPKSKRLVRYRCNDDHKKGCKSNGYLRHDKLGDPINDKPKGSGAAQTDVPVREVPREEGGGKPVAEPPKRKFFFDLD